jgi:hypothetical protein
VADDTGTDRLAERLQLRANYVERPTRSWPHPNESVGDLRAAAALCEVADRLEAALRSVLDPIEDPEVGYRIARRALSEAQAWRGAEAKMTNDGTLPDRLRNMVRNPNAIGTHSAACWQWHDDCALLLAADRVAERDADVSAGAVARTVAMSHIAAERDAERAARERAETEARQLREGVCDRRLCCDGLRPES